ncbi:sensor histidine kinase [Sphaerisporangium fuscum]|uniref:sensor histidine kinase n=1 Tax=Sphaerisporangium fuscum TaxID=2835868 RepID=UPI001BDCD88D|nr:histidine kinase [Sphaerisporangium fuscum]
MPAGESRGAVIARPEPTRPLEAGTGPAGRAGAIGRAALVPVALLAGTATALLQLAFLLVAAVVVLACLASVRARRRTASLILAVTGRLTALELRRLRLTAGEEDPVPGTQARYDGRRSLSYVMARWPVGILGGAVLLLFAFGLSTAVRAAWSWLNGGNVDGMPPTTPILLYLGVAGLVLLFLVVSGMAGVVALERALARRMLGPSPTELLERRIAELAESRAGIVAAVDQERRRIERDLHDGLQQRLVALGMLIGRARRGRSPELLDTLLLQAHQEARDALADLREVAWRVYPTGLDTLGLREALATVAERSALPVRIHYDLAERPEPTVETAAYFVVCEAVTNAAKHADAHLVTVHLARHGTMIVVRVEDDGRGGADPEGTGLSGLARRVAALDGRFRLDSPPGGPTVVTAELPCA